MLSGEHLWSTLGSNGNNPIKKCAQSILFEVISLLHTVIQYIGRYSKIKGGGKYRFVHMHVYFKMCIYMYIIYAAIDMNLQDYALGMMKKKSYIPNYKRDEIIPSLYRGAYRKSGIHQFIGTPWTVLLYTSILY